MQILSPAQQHTITGGITPFCCPGQDWALTDTALPLFIPLHHARIFADTVTARELWPA